MALTYVAATGRYIPGEDQVLRDIINLRSPFLNRVMLSISALGSANVVVPLWLAAILWFLWARKWIALTSIAPVLLGYPLYGLVKTLVNRPTPSPTEFAWLHDFTWGYFIQGLVVKQVQVPTEGVSVPVLQRTVSAQAINQTIASGYVSGHALLALLFYGTLGWLVWNWLSPSFLRSFIVVGLVSLAMLVGLARVYMGVHYPSDVLGSWFLGIVFLFFGSRFCSLTILKGESHHGTSAP